MQAVLPPGAPVARLQRRPDLRQQAGNTAAGVAQDVLQAEIRPVREQVEADEIGCGHRDADRRRLVRELRQGRPHDDAEEIGDVANHAEGHAARPQHPHQAGAEHHQDEADLRHPWPAGEEGAQGRTGKGGQGQQQHGHPLLRRRRIPEVHRAEDADHQAEPDRCIRYREDALEQQQNGQGDGGREGDAGRRAEAQHAGVRTEDLLPRGGRPFARPRDHGLRPPASPAGRGLRAAGGRS
jgi:hypothetical protein